MITEEEGLDSVVEAINKGRIYKYNLRPWTEEQVVTVVREPSDLYHLRTNLDKRVSQFNDQLIQAELNLESLNMISPQTKFDYITRLKSTIAFFKSSK